MNIYGIGTDIVNIDRIRKSLKNKKFIERIFNKKEIQRCKLTLKKSNCYAKRFAAKEAFSKALGTGIAQGINFNEIIILNEKNGKPFIKLLDKTNFKYETNERSTSIDFQHFCNSHKGVQETIPPEMEETITLLQNSQLIIKFENQPNQKH